MSDKTLKRVLSAVRDVKLKRTNSFDSRRKPQYNPPLPRRMRRMSNKVEGLIGGVAVSGPQGPERKKFDVLQNTPVSVSTGAPLLVSLTAGITEGTGLANRIGARTHLKAIDGLIDVTALTTATATVGITNAVFIDFYLVWDKQPDGVLPTAGAIVVTPTSDLTFGNVNNLERFQILRRDHVNLDLAGGLTQKIKWHMPLDVVQRFADATGNPQTNDIYLLATTSAPAAASGILSASVSYVMRVTFTDQ